MNLKWFLLFFDFVMLRWMRGEKNSQLNFLYKRRMSHLRWGQSIHVMQFDVYTEVNATEVNAT